MAVGVSSGFTHAKCGKCDALMILPMATQDTWTCLACGDEHVFSIGSMEYGLLHRIRELEHRVKTLEGASV